MRGIFQEAAHFSGSAGATALPTAIRQRFPIMVNFSRAMPSDPPHNSTSKTGIRFMFRALSHRNYQLFFSGQSVSMIGTWMTRIATSWLVYKLTGSALLLGVVGF